MSTHEKKPQPLHGHSLEEQRAVVLARGKPFPPYEEMIIEGLTDEEEDKFLAAIDNT